MFNRSFMMSEHKRSPYKLLHVCSVNVKLMASSHRGVKVRKVYIVFLKNACGKTLCLRQNIHVVCVILLDSLVVNIVEYTADDTYCVLHNIQSLALYINYINYSSPFFFTVAMYSGNS